MDSNCRQCYVTEHNRQQGRRIKGVYCRDTHVELEARSIEAIQPLFWKSSLVSSRIMHFVPGLWELRAVLVSYRSTHEEI
jgi:hypothetical protein